MVCRGLTIYIRHIYIPIGRMKRFAPRNCESGEERDVILQQMRELTRDKRAAESSEQRKAKWHSDCNTPGGDTRMPSYLLTSL